MFVSLIGTCGTGSAPICCEGHFPTSTKFGARRRAEPNGSNSYNNHIYSKGFKIG